MTKREATLVQIKAIVAEEGKATAEAIRLYSGGRIGYSAFMKAVQQGMAVYVARQQHGK